MTSGSGATAPHAERTGGAFRRAIVGWHRMLSKSPTLSRCYLSALSRLSRATLSGTSAVQAENLVMDKRVTWPHVRFGALPVIVGEHTKVRLIPHIGEFDRAALFTKRFAYEKETFSWLETNAVSRYDSVIEIGANAGVFSVFFDALIRANPKGRLQKIVSFEPALEPFARLLENLRANDARHVVPFRAAAADTTGVRSFYEPKDHLANGSLLPEFAQIFSDNVAENLVIALGPEDLSRFFQRGTKSLMKIDVEGYEPVLVRALAPLLRERNPDLLIEVLEGTPDPLEAIEELRGYRRSLITPAGLVPAARLTADPKYRDWLLESPH